MRIGFPLVLGSARRSALAEEISIDFGTDKFPKVVVTSLLSCAVVK